MDGLVVLGVFAVLWVLVGPALALVSASRANRRAEELHRRLLALETLPGESAPTGTAEEPVRPSFAAAFGPPPETPEEPAPGPWSPEAAAEPQAAQPADETSEPPSSPEPDATPISTEAASPQRESLESRIGARWSVLVGGLALALGAVFLVRYSVEAGLLGPGARVIAGLLLATLLLAGGEWLRRRDRQLDLPMVPKADVPAILTGAGAIALFATLYAAYALYGFLGSAAAFLLLTAASLATLFLSAIHGPGLAALGALGSYLAPLLVASATPQPLAIPLHTLTVTAAVLGIARIRRWTWLAVGGLVGSLGWGVLLGSVPINQAIIPLLMVAGLTTLYVAAFLAGLHATSIRDRTPDTLTIVGLVGVAVLALHYAQAAPAYPVIASGVLLAGAFGAIASRWPAAAPAAFLAAAVAVATVMLFQVAGRPLDPQTMRLGELEWSVLNGEDIGRLAASATALSLLVGLGSFFSAERAAATAPRTAGYFAGAGAAAPLLILIVVYLRHSPFETRPLVGAIALALGAAYGAMAERLIARRPGDAQAPGPALYAAGAVLALSFACAVGLATRFIPIALSLGVAGIVWVGLRRPVRLLPILAVVVAALAWAAIMLGPAFTPEELGTRPILNGLMLRLGVPAAAILFAGELQRRHRDGIESALLQTIGLVLAALFVTLEIRHAANSGAIATGPAGIGEQGALTLAMLAFALGLQRISAMTKSGIYNAASLVSGALAVLSIGVAHFGTANPLLTGRGVGGGAFVNLLLPGYLLPAIGAAWVAFKARPVRPRWYVAMMAALALLLAFSYLSLMVRHAFHGSRLDIGPVYDAENWTYSAVWLAFGLLLLAAGITFGSQMVRAASGLVIALVVTKVFLFDMAALTGVLRAASFLGLGAVLIGIGRLYQTLLRSSRADPQPPA